MGAEEGRKSEAEGEGVVKIWDWASVGTGILMDGDSAHTFPNGSLLAPAVPTHKKKQTKKAERL